MKPRMTLDQAIDYFKKCLDFQVPVEYGACNKFCPACYYRAGHPIIWCSRCGTRAVVYTSQSIRPTWRQYILHAKTEIELEIRLRSFLYTFGSWDAPSEMTFPFVWYKKSKRCTTPSFIAIFKPLLTDGKVN